jgi:hypothetical protein
MPSSIDYLISAQHEAGGWGYSTSQKPVVEPTAAVLLAIRNEPGAVNPFQKGLSWLLSCQHQDGGWGISDADPESGWHTAWALIALKYSNQGGDSINKAVEWLTHVSTYQISQDEFNKTQIPVSDNIGALVWPWLPGQVCWIEPTALAALALDGIAQSPLSTARINATIEYFRQNRTPTGGWDIGNAGPLDTIISPRAYPTGLVLMTLARIAPKEIKDNDLAALRQDMQQDPSILSQSCGLLAIRLLRGSDPMIYENIKGSQLQNGSWNNNPFFTAWAMMALRGNI